MAIKSFTVHENSRDVYSRAILKQNVSPFEFICLQKYLKCFANRHLNFLMWTKRRLFIQKLVYVSELVKNALVSKNSV